MSGKSLFKMEDSKEPKPLLCCKSISIPNLGCFSPYFSDVTVDKCKYWLPEIWWSLTQLARFAPLPGVNHIPHFDQKIDQTNNHTKNPLKTQGGRKCTNQEPQQYAVLSKITNSYFLFMTNTPLVMVPQAVWLRKVFWVFFAKSKISQFLVSGTFVLTLRPSNSPSTWVRCLWVGAKREAGWHPPFTKIVTSPFMLH